MAQTRLSKVSVLASYSTPSVTHSPTHSTYSTYLLIDSPSLPRFISALNDVGDETTDEYSPDVSKDDVSKKVRHITLYRVYRTTFIMRKLKEGIEI
jgi:hypothetical protein